MPEQLRRKRGSIMVEIGVRDAIALTNLGFACGMPNLPELVGIIASNVARWWPEYERKCEAFGVGTSDMPPDLATAVDGLNALGNEADVMVRFIPAGALRRDQVEERYRQLCRLEDAKIEVRVARAIWTPGDEA